MKAEHLFSTERRKVPERTPPLNHPFISPVFIRGIIVGIILLIVLVHIGFSKTYIRFFPKFDGFKATQHFHGIMMMGWLLMLLVQPILILKGKTMLHRRIGSLELCIGAVGIPLIKLLTY